MKRQISISTELDTKLKEEENASKLIEQLLTWYYAGAYDVDDLNKQREKVRNQLLRITQSAEQFTLSNNRLASAVENLLSALEDRHYTEAS